MPKSPAKKQPKISPLTRIRTWKKKYADARTNYMKSAAGKMGTIWMTGSAPKPRSPAAP